MWLYITLYDLQMWSVLGTGQACGAVFMSVGVTDVSVMPTEYDCGFIHKSVGGTDPSVVGSEQTIHLQTAW